MTDFDYQQLDEMIHSRIRLAIMASLAATSNLPFTTLREQIGTTDGNLSVHLRKLEDAGYVQVDKQFVNRRPLTLYALTNDGREAFDTYVTYLESILRPSQAQKEN